MSGSASFQRVTKLWQELFALAVSSIYRLRFAELHMRERSQREVQPCSFDADVFAGRVAKILVPRPFDSIVNSPWTCRTRSRIPLIPTPVPCA